MHFKFPIFSIFLVSFWAAGGQVASHAPTAMAQPSSSDGGLVKLTPVGKPVARVNGSVLTDTDLVREEYLIFPYARQHNGIPKELEPGIRGGAFKMIVFEELVYQEAQREKMTIPAAKMRRAEIDFKKQFSTPEEFNALFESEFHGSEPMLKEKIRRSLLIEALLKREIDDKDTVSAAEVRADYDKDPARFQYPETYTFQSISILPPRNATAAQLREGRKRADDALRQAKPTKTAEEFGMLAEKISDDDYRVMMGQHKPLPVNQLVPQVLKALAAMKPGDVSDLVQVEQAYTIVRLNEHRPAGKTGFEAVKAQLENEVKTSKANQLRAALDKKLRQNAKVETM